MQGFSFRTFLARTAVDPELLLGSVKDAVWAIDPSVGISASGTIEGSLREFYRDPQFDLALLGSFAAAGLALVAIGVFGVMAYSVSLQAHEIGVRMAIGARQTQILRRVLFMGGRLVAAGVISGLGGAHLFSSALVSAPTSEPITLVTYVAVGTLVFGVGLVACYLPAYRATKVDPS